MHFRRLCMCLQYVAVQTMTINHTNDFPVDVKSAFPKIKSTNFVSAVVFLMQRGLICDCEAKEVTISIK